jgi:hypothetical protein
MTGYIEVIPLAWFVALPDISGQGKITFREGVIRSLGCGTRFFKPIPVVAIPGHFPPL